MSKIFIALILIVVLAVGIFFGAQYLGKQAAEGNQAVLVLESGSVKFKTPKDKDFIVATEEETFIPSGTIIRTEQESYARIFLLDNSLISLDQNTEIQMDYSNEGTTIQQFIGTTWNRVQSVAKGGTYKVETPNTIAAVRGTVFEVWVDKEQNSGVSVEESEVEVSSFELKPDGVKEILKSENLTRDEFVEILMEGLGEDLLKEATPEERRTTFWALRNKILDEEYSGMEDLSPKEFRAKLREKLRNREEFQQYRLGLSDINPEALKEELDNVLALLQITETSCHDHSLSEMSDARLKVRRFAKYINKSDSLDRLLGSLISSCEDGVFSLDEAETIDRLVTNFNN